MRRKQLSILAVPQILSFVLWVVLFLRPVLVFDEMLAPAFAALIGASLLCSVAALITYAGAPWERRTQADFPVAITALVLNGAGSVWALGMGAAVAS